MSKQYFPPEVKDAIERYMWKTKMSVIEFYEESGISRPTIYSILYSNVRYISNSTVDKLKKIWLLED